MRPPTPAGLRPERGLASGRRRGILLLLPALIYLAGVLLLGDWLIDDAGISFAYAKNLAAGQGFVSQPGRPPVEGYSNFLWVALLAMLHLVRLFHPVLAAKILGVALVLCALLILQRTLERHVGRWGPGFFAALWIACAPPIVIWTSSGLENGLMLLVVVALWSRAVERGPHWQVHCGLLAALAAMTHPEGIVYLGFAAVASVQDELARNGRRAARAALGLARCLAGFLALFGPFFALRLMVFGKPWPQPYYAKRVHASFADQLDEFARHPGLILERVAEIGRVCASAPGPWILAAILVGIAVLAASGRLRRPLGLAAWLFAIAFAAFVLIGPDWMGEYRFATGAVAAFAITLSMVLFSADGARAPGTNSRLAGGAANVVGAALSVVILWGAAPRLLRFARNPPTPYGDVERRVAERFTAYGTCQRL